VPDWHYVSPDVMVTRPPRPLPRRLRTYRIGEQGPAMKVFALLGFSQLLRLPNYVKDMQAVTHDYVLMGLDLRTDEEYAGVGGGGLREQGAGIRSQGTGTRGQANDVSPASGPRRFRMRYWVDRDDFPLRPLQRQGDVAMNQYVLCLP